MATRAQPDPTLELAILNSAVDKGGAARKSGPNPEPYSRTAWAGGNDGAAFIIGIGRVISAPKRPIEAQAPEDNNQVV